MRESWKESELRSPWGTYISGGKGPLLRKYSQFRLYGLRIYGIFGFMLIIWSLDIIFRYRKLRKFSCFGYMVNG